LIDLLGHKAVWGILIDVFGVLGPINHPFR